MQYVVLLWNSLEKPKEQTNTSITVKPDQLLPYTQNSLPMLKFYMIVTFSYEHLLTVLRISPFYFSSTAAHNI